MNSPWTPEQREWLQALGHAVFALAGSEDRVEGVEASRGGEADPRQEMPPHASLPSVPVPPAPVPATPPVHDAPAPVSPARPDSPSPPAPLPGGATRTPPVPGRMGDPLYRALLRATARRTPREGESVLQSLEAFDPDAGFDALRADPARKRALWLQLRAARKAGRR